VVEALLVKVLVVEVVQVEVNRLALQIGTELAILATKTSTTDVAVVALSIADLAGVDILTKVLRLSEVAIKDMLVPIEGIGMMEVVGMQLDPEMRLCPQTLGVRRMKIDAL